MAEPSRQNKLEVSIGGFFAGHFCQALHAQIALACLYQQQWEKGNKCNLSR
jgi:hypothetical protein